MSDQVKVTYIPREYVDDVSTPYRTQAYVSSHTLFGTNRHSDVEVQLEWSDAHNCYIQVDDWEWTFDFEGTPTKVKPTIDSPIHIRRQPLGKRRSKAAEKRRKNGT